MDVKEESLRPEDPMPEPEALGQANLRLIRLLWPVDASTAANQLLHSSVPLQETTESVLPTNLIVQTSHLVDRCAAPCTLWLQATTHGSPQDLGEVLLAAMEVAKL